MLGKKKNYINPSLQEQERLALTYLGYISIGVCLLWMAISIVVGIAFYILRG